MKKLLFLLTILVSAIFVSCNDSKKEADFTETRMTLKVLPQLYVENIASQTKSYYQVQDKATQVDFRIPVGDIVGFDYQENYTYEIVVICVQPLVSGIPSGDPWYKLETLLSKEYTPDGPVDPIKPVN